METSTRSVGTTLLRGLTALHAGIQIVAAMFSLHSTGNACNVCVQPTTKMKSKYSLFISYESGKKFGITE